MSHYFSYLRVVIACGLLSGISTGYAQETDEASNTMEEAVLPVLEEDGMDLTPSTEKLANPPAASTSTDKPLSTNTQQPRVRIESNDIPSATLSKVRSSIGTVTILVGDADIGELTRLRRRARDAAINALATDGFFNPQVSVSVERGTPPTWVFTIDAGPRSKIYRLQIGFQGAITTTGFVDRLRLLESAWSLRLGDYFSNDEWERAKSNLLNNLLDEDFPAARWVETAANVDVEKSSVSLRVEIDSGPQVLISGLKVTGLKNLNDDVITRYVRYQPNMPFRRDLLIEWQKQLQLAPFFRGAQLDIDLVSIKERQTTPMPTPRKSNRLEAVVQEPMTDDDGSMADGLVKQSDGSVLASSVRQSAEMPTQMAVPLLVRVTEARPRRASILLGADSDVGPRAEVVYRQNVMWGKAVAVETGAHADRDRKLVYADVFTAPNLNGYQTSYGVLAHDTDIQGVHTKQAAVAVVQVRERRGLEFEGRVEYDTRLAARLAHENTRVEGGGPAFNVNTVTGTWDWTRRDVNDRNDPREGNVLALGVGVGTDLSGDNQFYRTTVRGQQWWELSSKDVITMRAELGRVFARQDYRVPQDFLFRTGGARTIRGYPFLGIGRQVGDAVLGDRTMVVVSSEYTHFMTDIFGVAGFVDVGDVSDTVSNLDFKTGVGMGVRVRTPAGPVNVDLAYGVEARRLRLSFSLGLAF